MKEEIIEKLQSIDIETGDHYVDFEISNNVSVSIHYKFDYETTLSYPATYLQPAEYDVTDVEFRIVSIFIADEKKVYPNNDKMIIDIQRQLTNYLHKQLQ